jgi:uncharacterized membrane protein
LKVEPLNKEDTSTLRLIFLNLLITVFIIMSYFYISEVFGSISTPFIKSNEFELLFGPTLLVFTFFSILAGPYQAFISGFIGEILYQLAFYETVELDWCFLIAFFGFIVGFYRYQPLKYQDGMKVYYTFLILIISTFLMTSAIIIIQFSKGSINIEAIIINYGLKFFMQSLLSINFLVPGGLIAYDKALASKERHLYYLLLTHHPPSASDHTFTFEFGRTKIYFCSRCSGMIIGIILSMFFVHVTELIYNSQFSPELALAIIIIFPIPGLIDWGTQRLLLRTSTTTSRIFTGFIIGVAMHFMTFTRQYYFITLIITTVYFVILFLLIFFGQKKLVKELNKELNYEPMDEIDSE